MKILWTCKDCGSQRQISATRKKVPIRCLPCSREWAKRFKVLWVCKGGCGQQLLLKKSAAAKKEFCLLCSKRPENREQITKKITETVYDKLFGEEFKGRILWKCSQCGKEKKLTPGDYKKKPKRCGACAHPFHSRNGKFEDIKTDGNRKNWLLRERGHRCESCQRETWKASWSNEDQPIPLELDHIDGHPGHNKKENLRLLCPNCHALTPFWKARNIGRHKGTKRQEVMARYPDYRAQKRKEGLEESLENTHDRISASGSAVL